MVNWCLLTLKILFLVDQYESIAILELPKNVNWREKSAITYVKDQGQKCGEKLIQFRKCIEF